MSADDGHTVNIGPPDHVSEPLPMTDLIDTDRIRNRVLCNADVPCGKLTMGQVWQDVEPLALCDEVDRLRAENEALADAAIGVWLDARLKSAVDTDWIVSGTAMDALRNAIPEVRPAPTGRWRPCGYCHAIDDTGPCTCGLDEAFARLKADR